MEKAIVRQWDRTTTGGQVVSASSTSSDMGKLWVLSGDLATCGVCKGVFPISGSAIDVMEDGRATVVHWDLVLCPCGKNHVMASQDCTSFIETVNGRSGSDEYSILPTQDNLINQVDKVFCQKIKVLDSSTGLPLVNQEWIACMENGQVKYGRTDDNGFAIVKTNGEERFRLHAVFSSPKRMLKPEGGM